MKDIESINEFNAIVLEEKSKDIVVEFWMPCPQSDAMISVMQEFEKETELDVVRVNVDENPEIAKEYNVISVPHVFRFSDGEIVTESEGAVPLPVLLQRLT